MKKILGLILTVLVIFANTPTAFAIQELGSKQQKPIVYNKDAKTIKYAFVFDGPSDKNKQVLNMFKTTITQSTAPDFKAAFPENLVFTGDWKRETVKKISDKALASDATMVVSLGYLSTKYYNSLSNKKKFVITIDQYGLRDFGEGFFNPVSQSIKGVYAFKNIINYRKIAVLMNENYYNIRKDWQSFLAPKLKDIDFVIVPATKDVNKTISSIPSDVDAVVFTPLFNLTTEERTQLIKHFNDTKTPTFSTLGKEDVELGVLLGSGAYDLDRKVAEATSFNIKGALKGNVKSSDKLMFFEDEIFYMNADTAEAIGYAPHLRLLNNAEVISHKKPKMYDLSAVFDTLEKQNLDIERKRHLVRAAKNSAISAGLRYLPTLNVNLGYQQYNHAFADSARLLYPEKTGVFQIGVDQVIYSPALVTNILIKKKQHSFQKQEKIMTEQNMGIDIATTYIETLMLRNAIGVQKEYVKQTREILAIARVRNKMGKCGQEEIMRWATQLNVSERKLLDMEAEYKNLKIAINKILNQPQTENFELVQLTAMDPAFYTKDLNIIDYVSTPQALEAFTQMLINRAYEVAPELAKLKLAIKMKNNERNMYYQKFILPDAKLNYTYTSMMHREFTRPMDVSLDGIKSALAGTPLAPAAAAMTPISIPNANATHGLFGIYAQWKPIEGGTKIAEIRRIEAEKKELQAYETEVRTEIEREIRDIINKAIAAYFIIEKNYKAMYAAQENYNEVKKKYLQGTAPIAQVIDAQNIYFDSKLAAANSQNSFFKQLVWVQRAICAVNWAAADDDSKKFIESVKSKLEKKSDIAL